MPSNRREFLKKASVITGAFSSAVHPASPPEIVQETIYLWKKGSKNDLPTEESDRPKMVVYYNKSKPAQKQTAVVVCPGGGYYNLAEAHEGHDIARFFMQHGIVGAVLFYRHRDHQHPAPYADACRAMRLMRKNAAKYNVDAERVGIMGFSAGGHLAATVTTQPDLYKEPEDDLAATVSARPDRAVLGYPVISFMEFAHTGSRDNLLGTDPDPQLVRQLSNHRQVTANTPPVFLFHTADDSAVPVENSFMFAEACVRNKVPVALVVLPTGKHGVGMAPDNPALNIWTKNLISWMDDWTKKL